MVDVVCASVPPAGGRVHADVTVRAGGAAVNAALYAAATGTSAAVVGRIGDDPAGELVASTLSKRGVRVYLARDPDAPTGAAVALRGADGSVSVVAARGANAMLSVSDIPGRLEANVLLVSGFALFQEGSNEAARAALARFDGDVAGVDLASPTLAAEADLDATSRARVVFATAEEARAATGLDPEDAVRALARQTEIACVKLGAAGAVAAKGDAVVRSAAPIAARESPFGAGDAFAAEFLLAVGGGASLEAALDRAALAGAAAASNALV